LLWSAVACPTLLPTAPAAAEQHGRAGPNPAERHACDPNWEMYQLGILLRDNLTNLRVGDSVEGMLRYDGRARRRGLNAAAGSRLRITNRGNGRWRVEAPASGRAIESKPGDNGLVWHRVSPSED
jgi:hypothetical protein